MSNTQICIPKLIDNEYVCSICGWGKGLNINAPFTRECTVFQTDNGEIFEEQFESTILKHKDVDKNIILVLGTHSSLSSCMAQCLEKLGVYMGEDTIGGEAKWLINFCNSHQPLPYTFYKDIDYREFGDWLINNMRIAKEKNCPFGIKFPTLCAWDDILTKIEEEYDIRFKIINMDRPLHESIQSAKDRTIRDNRWGGKLMREMSEHDRIGGIISLQKWLHQQKNNILSKREQFKVQSWKLLQYPHILIREIVSWLEYYFGYFANEKYICNAIESVSPQKATHSAKYEIDEWIKNTTIIIKAFERPQLLNRCLDSIYYQHPYVHIIVGDDSENPEIRCDTSIFHLPYDVGLSAGRNFLVDKVYTQYILLLDDDYQFDGRTKIGDMYEKITNIDCDLVSGNVDSSKKEVNWLGHFRNIDDKLYVCKGAVEDIGGIKRYDWTPNFFIAKTDMVKKYKWNEQYKLAEHMDWFYRLKKNDVIVTNYSRSYVRHDAPDWFAYPEIQDEKYSNKYVSMRKRSVDFINKWKEEVNLCGIEGLGNLDKIVTELNQYYGMLPIPRRIHQIWVGPKPMPHEYRDYCKQWRTMHNDWDYRLWGDTDAYMLMDNNLVDLYHKPMVQVQKSDIIRLLAVYYYGGVYLDVDFQPFVKLDEFIKGKHCFVVQARKEGSVTNAVFGAVPKHPFIKLLIENITKYWDVNKGNCIGPPMFNDILNTYNVYKFPLGTFFPYTWDEKDSLEKFNYDNYKNAIAVHHFDASWLRK